jgi:hypothetical protein
MAMNLLIGEIEDSENAIGISFGAWLIEAGIEAKPQYSIFLGSNRSDGANESVRVGKNPELWGPNKKNTWHYHEPRAQRASSFYGAICDLLTYD